MDRRLVDLLTEFEAARAGSDIFASISSFLENLGFTHSIYTFINPIDPSLNRIWTSMPDSWVTHYIDNNYQQRDPYFRYCCKSFQGIRTGREFAQDYDYLNDDERQLIDEAAEVGLSAGISAPVRLVGDVNGFGGWNFGSSFRREDLEKVLDEHDSLIRLAGFYAHEYLNKFQGGRSCEKSCNVPDREFETLLSERERDCLSLLAQGLRTAQIAERLGIKTVTVDLHLKNCRQKLKAATREEALARAIRLGEIMP